MTFAHLPDLNAMLNSLSTVFLLAGYARIRRGDRLTHQRFMIAAVISSTLFLASYITYHFYVAYVLHRGPTVFHDPAWFRPIYLLILGSHTILAIVILPMVLLTLYRAWRGHFESHRHIARWTYPLWLYVSVTGVLIYLLLYKIFPQT